MSSYDALIVLGMLYLTFNLWLAWDDLVRAGIDIWKGIRKSFPFLAVSLLLVLFGLPLILIEWRLDIKQKRRTNKV